MTTVSENGVADGWIGVLLVVSCDCGLLDGAGDASRDDLRLATPGISTNAMVSEAYRASRCRSFVGFLSHFADASLRGLKWTVPRTVSLR
jgi:hypothetical protein